MLETKTHVHSEHDSGADETAIQKEFNDKLKWERLNLTLKEQQQMLQNNSTPEAILIRATDKDGGYPHRAVAVPRLPYTANG